MNLILKATNDELHYHIKLEDQTMTTRALPLCLLCSDILQCQSSVLPRAGILSLRLSLPLLVVIFPLHVSDVSNANACIESDEFEEKESTSIYHSKNDYLVVIFKQFFHPPFQSILRIVFMIKS